MPFCNRCGLQNADCAKFCRDCGSPIVAPTADQQPGAAPAADLPQPPGITAGPPAAGNLPMPPTGAPSAGFSPREGEIVFADARANLFRGVEAVGGRIQITNQRVCFQPHSMNVQKQPLEIPIEQILAVSKRKTMGVISNGMLVRCKSGIEYKFVVEGRERLMSIIQGQLR